MSKKLVVIGPMGTALDNKTKEDRWSRWRPTVSICQHNDLRVDRIELLCNQRFFEAAKVVRDDIRTVSPETTLNIVPFELNDPWDFEEVYTALYDFARAYKFDPENENYLVHMSTGTHVMQICLFLLLESKHIPARILQTSPLPREINDPAGTYSIIDLDLSRYDKIASRYQEQFQDGVHFLKSGIETKNAAFNSIIEQLARVCTNSVDPILLTGPTGSGKTRLARLIFEWKKKCRKVTGDFVEVNCATLRGTSAMSALFGHARGAYTGAVTNRSGLLKAADNGLLFLDEVGELGLDEQAMLLRAIEEKRFYPLGSDKEQHSDFQIICGTNRSLTEMVRQGIFRADLLSRIDLWMYCLPGLADRPEDIEPNLNYELEQTGRRKGRLISFSKEARSLFLSLAVSGDAVWSGNFRDLAGAVTRMATLSDGGRITEDTVRGEWARLLSIWQTTSSERLKNVDMNVIKDVIGDAVDCIDPFDIPQLAGVIRECKKASTIAEAGRKLFSFSRKNKSTENDSDRLRKYLQKFNISWKTLKK